MSSQITFIFQTSSGKISIIFCLENVIFFLILITVTYIWLEQASYLLKFYLLMNLYSCNLLVIDLNCLCVIHTCHCQLKTRIFLKQV
jgi:hypothetical protein